MALGRSKVQQRFENPREILGDRLKEGSIYRLLADHGHELFGNDYFADCYSDSVRGRPTIAARVMATVMMLQAFEGLSDAEAVDGLSFDLRWQAAAGVDAGYEGFIPLRWSASATACGPPHDHGASSRTPRWWPKRQGR